MITADQLLKNLLDTYVRLKPSPVAGVGVFAIRDIPKGCRKMFTQDNGEWIKIPVKDIQALPVEIREVVENYYTFDHEYYYVENTGLKKMDICCCINHSDTPNIHPVNNGEFFEASRDIMKGEELFIDYALIAEE